MRCEISCNVDVDDGISNGTSCTIMAAKGSDQSRKYSVIWVKFDDKEIGKNCRGSKKKLMTNNIQPSETPIQTIKRTLMVGRYKTVQVIREQFPLRPAAAKSCHRCQGDTMAAAVVDFTGSCFPHSHYVALSRVKEINSLFIRNLNESKIHMDCRVKEEMERLNADMKLETIIDHLNQDCFTMLIHNVRSLRKHFKDAIKDCELLHPDIIVYVESNLSPKEDSSTYEISGYTVHRFDNASHYGISIYIETNFQATFGHSIKYCNAGMME